MLVLLLVLIVSLFVILNTFAKFRLLMFVLKPTTLEEALQHVADLIGQRMKLEARIAELEDALAAIELEKLEALEDK